MKILLTGATGFIGSCLLPKLLFAGHEALAAVRTEKAVELVQRIGAKAEIVNDGSDYAAICEENEIQAVLHLATCFRSAHKLGDVGELIDSNVRFGAMLADGASRAGVKWFVNTATTWQHYQGKPYSPVNLYAATKQAFADILKFYHESGSLSVATLAICDSYGPNDKRPKLLNLWKRMSITGEQLDMSPGEQQIDILHVDDISAGLLALLGLLESDPSSVIGKEKYLSSGSPMTLRSLAGEFESVTGKALNIRWGASQYRAREMMCIFTGEPLPGWKPEIALHDGLKSFWEGGKP